MKKARDLILAALLVPPVAIVLYSYPPTEYHFYPPCMLYTLTGLHCPGCGGTRCANALLHLNLPQALAYNSLVILALPFVAVYFGRRAYGLIRGRPVTGRPLPTWCVRGILVVILAYFVLRNLPLEPFNLLAPHKL